MRITFLFILCLFSVSCFAQDSMRLSKRDRRKDVRIVTNHGDITIRLSDHTPLHRDNFIRLVKRKYFDSILFHRVIKGFVIQAGDPNSRSAPGGVALGNGGPPHKVPAEINPLLFHHRGALGAAREGDAANPERKSSGSQFYIVSGRTFTDAQLDSVEKARLGGKKIPEDRRHIYRTTGGTPQLDGSYTVFGQVVKGLDAVDRIANLPTSKTPPDRPLADARIIKVKLVKRVRRNKAAF